MRYTQETGALISKAEIAHGIFDVTVQVPRIAAAASPGKFVNILCDGHTLRRPISICGFDAAQGALRLVFEVRGKGTDWLSKREVGDVLDMTGPLGHGFSLTDSAKKAVIIGGGIGTPPLLPIAQFYGANATVITGFRSANIVCLQEDFVAAGAKTILCTDDGSMGFHGFTTQALEQHLQDNPCDILYTCGPKPMMRGIANIAKERGIPCVVSLEERMGCGVGACLCCATPTHDHKGSHMSRVCLNGPVFNAEEVDWNA